MSLKLYKVFRVCFSIGLCHYSADLKGQFSLKSQTHISNHGFGEGHKKTDCIQGPGYVLRPWNSTTGKWENMLILWIAQPLDVLLLKWIIMTVVTLLLFIQHYYGGQIFHLSGKISQHHLKWWSSRLVRPAMWFTFVVFGSNVLTIIGWISVKSHADIHFLLGMSCNFGVPLKGWVHSKGKIQSLCTHAEVWREQSTSQALQQNTIATCS